MEPDAASPTEVKAMPLPHGLNHNKNHTKGHKTTPQTPGAQSDFSFSFMCKKTTLKTKRPAIMEKALA